MATKILELEISGNIPPIFFEEGYDHYRVLIRSYKQPLGWIAFSKKNHVGFGLSPNEIKELVKKQIGNTLVQQMLLNSTGLKKNDNFPAEAISVIVCTRNRTSQLSTCLQTLSALNYNNYEIIIVDNAPDSNDTYNLVANLPVRYVREDRPGLDWARNRGIAEAKYDIVAFTDDDVRVDAYWLQAIAKIFSDKQVMGTSGYVAPAELETESQQVFELNYGGMGHGFKQRTFKREILSEKQLLWASSFGIGANMAFRKKIFEQIGAFDTALDVGTPSHGGGDIEMFHRLVAKSYLFVYDPSMLIWHYHRREDKALRKQIFDNGRSFGCYLIDCFRKRTISRSSIISFFWKNWLLKWNIKNLLGRYNGIPKKLSLAELYGMLTSPFAYWKTKRRDKEIHKVNNALPNIETLVSN